MNLTMANRVEIMENVTNLTIANRVEITGLGM